MSHNPLFEGREWLTVEEAAQEISSEIGRAVTEAGVLRLALDGQLTLSVILPEGTVADCWDIPEHFPEDRYDDPLYVPDNTQPKPLNDIWNLPAIPPAHKEIQARHNQLRGWPSVSLDGLIGATVERRGVRCRLRKEGDRYSSPASVIPKGSVIVVRCSEIADWLVQAGHGFPKRVRQPKKRVWKRERPTLLRIIRELAAMTKTHIKAPLPSTALDDRTVLLRIIAALAKKAGITAPPLTKQAEVLAKESELRGDRVSARSVEDHLKEALALLSTPVK
jgi:hypothetical protein